MHTETRLNLLLALALIALWLANRETDFFIPYLLPAAALTLVIASLLPTTLMPLLPTSFGIIALVGLHTLFAGGSAANEGLTLAWFVLAGLLSARQGGVPFTALATACVGYIVFHYGQGYAENVTLDAAPGFIVFAGLLMGGALSGWGRGEHLGQLEGEPIVLERDRYGACLVHGDEAYHLETRSPDAISPDVAKAIIVSRRRADKAHDTLLKELDKELHRASRSAKQLTLILILPKFGNAVWSREGRDQTRVRARLRPYDSLHRYLDGHALLLPDTDELAGHRMVERLMRHVPPQQQVDVVVAEAHPNDNPRLFLNRSKRKLEEGRLNAQRTLWKRCQEADWSDDWQATGALEPWR